MGASEIGAALLGSFLSLDPTFLRVYGVSLHNTSKTKELEFRVYKV